MVTGLFHVKINGNKKNKVAAFHTLLISGASILCLEDEEYVVEEKGLKKLEQNFKKGVDFEEIKRKEGCKVERKQNDSKTTL